MRVTSEDLLLNFWMKHPDSKCRLNTWFHEAKQAEWKNFHDLKQRYPSASIINAERVVLNIGGNKYRLVVAISFENQLIRVRFVGTHAEYDKIKAETV